MNDKKTIYHLYQKWFISNLIIFLLTFILLISFVLLKLNATILLILLVFIIMTMGWGLTALTGMIAYRKKMQREENNNKKSITIKLTNDIFKPNANGVMFTKSSIDNAIDKYNNIYKEK